MTHSWHKNNVCLAAALMVAAVWTARPVTAATTFQYNIISIANGAPGQFPVIRFSVTDPTIPGKFYDLKADPAWTAGRLFLQIAWNTGDINNANSGSNDVPNGRGAAMPIPVNALLSSTPNGDGTYNVISPLPIPTVGASGTGEVAMEGHPMKQNPTTLLYTVAVPVKSVFKYFPITGTTTVARRQIVDVNKCMVCHRTDGTGVAPRLTLHGSNRTEEPQVCVVCHNPNNTDIPFRGLITTPVTNTNPTVVVGRNTYPEQGIDFKRLVHGIHASSAGFRHNPLVVIGFNGTIFDASKLIRFPSSLRNCLNCHIDNGTKGTFELPLASTVLGSTMNTQSEKNSTLANGTFVINTDPADNIRISPTAAVCSSCHDGSDVLSHMVSTGRANFNTTQAGIDAANRNGTGERCVSCHGPGMEESVRRVHLSDD